MSPLPPSPSRRGQPTAASKWRCTTIYYDAAAASTSNGETVGPIEGDLDPSFDRLDPRKGSPGSHNTANPLSPSPPATESASKCPRSSLPSRVAKVENCTSIAPTSLFLIGEGDGRSGEEEEAGQSQTIKGEREKWPHPSVRPFVCLAGQSGGNREWVRRRRRRRPLPLRLLLGFVLVVSRRRETMRTTTTTLKNEKYFPNGLASERQRGRRAE